MIPRSLAESLKSAAGAYPVVTLTGPRQSGKTFANDFLDGLRYWRNLAPELEPGHLIFGGDRSQRRSGFRVHAWWDFA